MNGMDEWKYEYFLPSFYLFMLYTLYIFSNKNNTLFKNRYIKE